MTSKKGTDRELYIASKFKKEGGYVTVRKYASIGAYDFIAFRKANCEGSPFGHCHSEMLAIQVKGNPYDVADRQALVDDAASFGARPVWVYRETRKAMLGLTKDGKPRTQAKWMTVYLDEPYLDWSKAIILKGKKKMKPGITKLKN